MLHHPTHKAVSALSQRWTVNSSRSMNIEMATSIQRWKRDVRFTTSSQSRYYDVVATLRQLCEECEMWTIHLHMVTFTQTCLSVMQGQYCDIKCRSLFPTHTLKVPPKSAFRRLNDELQSCSLTLYKNNFSALDFRSISKTTTFQWRFCDKPLLQKNERKICLDHKFQWP